MEYHPTDCLAAPAPSGNDPNSAHTMHRDALTRNGGSQSRADPSAGWPDGAKRPQLGCFMLTACTRAGSLGAWPEPCPATRSQAPHLTKYPMVARTSELHRPFHCTIARLRLTRHKTCNPGTPESVLLAMSVAGKRMTRQGHTQTD